MTSDEILAKLPAPLRRYGTPYFLEIIKWEDGYEVKYVQHQTRNPVICAGKDGIAIIHKEEVLAEALEKLWKELDHKGLLEEGG